MSLQSNTFNITKVRNGVDADKTAVLRTNVDTIVKFPEDYKGLGDVTTNEDTVYAMSPGKLTINLGNLKKDEGLAQYENILRKLYNIFILFNNIELRNFLADPTKTTRYITDGSDDFAYDFDIQLFYNDCINLSDTFIAANSRQNLLNIFKSTSPINIEVRAIYTNQVASKFVNFLTGSPLDIATMTVDSIRGISMAMQYAGLKFDSTGLTLKDSAFKVTHNGESVLYFDKDTQNFTVRGDIYAEGGEFSGKLVAATGTFLGEMLAGSGKIGGFRITKDSIVSDTGNLELFSQSSLEVGELELGSISSSTYENTDRSDRIRTKDYIKVLPETTYIFNSDAGYIYIYSFSSKLPSSLNGNTGGWKVSTNFSYTIPSGANYIRIVLAKSVTGGAKITPEDVEFLAIVDEDRSLINVENIHIGDNGVIDGYLKVGNLSLINPSKEDDNTVLKLEVPGTDPYFKLTNLGHILGKNWSIMKEPANYDPHFDGSVTARFGRLVAEDGDFTGTIRARDGVFSGEIVSSIITASTINTANFVTENTRSLGGSFIYKPTFEIIDIIPYTDDNKVLFELDNSKGTVSDYFSSLGVRDLTNALENGTLNSSDGLPGILSKADFRLRTANYIKVNAGEKLYCSINIASGIVSWIYVWPYDSNKKFIGSSLNIRGSSQVFTVPENVKYIKIVIANDNYTEATGLTKATFDKNKTNYYTKNSSNSYVLCTESSTFSSSETYYTHDTISKEDVKGFYLNNVNDKIIGISGQDTRFGRFVSISDNKVTVLFKDADYNILESASYLSDDFEQGTLSAGLPKDSASRIRSKDYIEVNPGDVLRKSNYLKSSSTATISWSLFIYYDKNYNYISSSDVVGSTAPGNAGYVKFLIANTTGGTLAPSDLDVFYFRNLTEKLNKYNNLTLFGAAHEDTLIGINSDDTSAGNILPPRSLVMETFTDLQESTESHTGYIKYKMNLLLGDLSVLKNLSSTFNHIDGYGLYADNVYLNGSLITNATDNFAGIHTLKDLIFDYNTWAEDAAPGDGTYTNEKIIFWGGAESLSDGDILKSPFIVTDKGSIFASRGEFKGAVLSDSLIVDTIIKTPMIYGTGQLPSLKIYNIGSTVPGTGSGYSNLDGYGGISFYKQIGYIDPGGSALDLLLLNLNEKSFTYYINGSETAANTKSFINFKSDGVHFDGATLTTGTTILSSRSIIDLTGGNTAAEITINGEGSSNELGRIELKFGSNGVLVDGEKVWNKGGMVRNDNEVIFYTANTQLDYKLKNGYYCLFVRK